MTLPLSAYHVVDSAAELPQSPGWISPRNEPPALEAMLLANLPLLDRIVGVVARRYRLTADETADLRGQTRLKLIENDYAVLRRWKGPDNLGAYLHMVVRRVAVDTRVAERGKWRPAAAARRAGPAGVLLDRLTSYHGYSFEQACAVLSTSRPGMTSAGALETIYEKLPIRARRTWVPEETLREIGTDSSSSVISQLISRGAAGRASRALAAGLVRLSTRDRQLVTWRFVDGMSVAEIARQQQLDQRWLYRHLPRVLARLRGAIEAGGITRRDLPDLLPAGERATPVIMGLRRGSSFAAARRPR